MNRLYAFLIIPLLFICCGALAQTGDLKEEAVYHFENHDYKKAYEAYDKLLSKSPKNLDYKFRLGYCCLHYPDKKARAIEIFEDLKHTLKTNDVNYFLGKAYHINYRFDDAIRLYTVYLNGIGSKIKDDEKELVEDAKLGILNCQNGIELIEKKVIADIQNIGGPINTEELEGVPVITADESMMLFTYRGRKSMGGRLNNELKPDPSGQFHEDIFMSTKSSDSTWSVPTPVDNINTKGNDAAVALSPDGQLLFTFLSKGDDGDLYMSTLNGSQWSKPTRMSTKINSDAWEGSCSISADGRFLYFASERAGGVGGKDLYVSEKINGDWTPAKNLGPKINTPYDDDAPFIHPDGITLFFSSKGHKSIGGYDIMYSVKRENDWIEPISMGIPLNTTEDDSYYVINARGDKGYFSSNRAGAGGKGDQDIYMVTPGILGERPVIALLKGTVYVDDKPVEAKIEVVKVSNNEAIGPYISNSKTGKYLMALSPGNDYKIHVSVPNLEPADESINVEKLERFLEIHKDFYLYSPDYVDRKDPKSVKAILDSLLGRTAEPLATGISTTTINNVNDASSPQGTITSTTTTQPLSLSPCDGGPRPDFSNIKGKSLNDATVYQKLLELGSDVCMQGLVFKIQIAAYQHPENYKYDHLAEFGKPEIVKYPDGITRFTQLQFSTIKEAEAARQKIIAKGQKDAWITTFVNGQRFTLEEFIMADFMGKSIN